jgi:hypothetical protein
MQNSFTYKKLFRFVAALCLWFTGSSAQAQTEPIYLDGAENISISKAENLQWYADVTLGPNCRLYIEDGARILFHGTNFKIMPGAQIYGSTTGWGSNTQGLGSGTIVFMQPNPGNGTTVQQTLDGGNSGNPANATQNTIPSIEINNPQGVKLVNSDVRIGTNINFVSGHLYADTHDAVLSSSATITGADATKYVVTAVSAQNNGGHLVKENFTGKFTFPVGMADGDYTPASITLAAANTIHVSVTDYANSAPTEVASNGMGRTWSIYGNTAAAATVSLQHNSSTNGSNFYTAANYVTQYGTSPNNTGDKTTGATDGWQLNNSSASSAAGGTGTETNSKAGFNLVLSATANQAWYTKLSAGPPTPDFTPSIDMNALNFDNGASRDFVVTISNLVNVASSGQVSFRLIKGNSFTITYNATTTTAVIGGSTAVNNADWTVTDAGSYFLCTLNVGKVIGGYGISKLGFTVMRNATTLSGSSQTVTAVVVAGSGGDSNSANNNKPVVITAN